MELKTHQGSSIYTERKEFEIYGVTAMRFNQFKNIHFKFREVICADVFCGTGRNIIDGEIIDGSPIRMLDGWVKANNNTVKSVFWFSDIRQDACNILEKIIKQRYQREIPVKKMSAADAVNELGNYLKSHPETYLCLTLDPNGPKDFPKYETQDLIKAFPNRIDVNPYISATAVNRQLGARNKAGYQLNSWLAGVENLDEGFIQTLVTKNRTGWIRKPIEGDRWRWTMIPSFGIFEPRNSWEKQGFVTINSEEAKNAIRFYCGGL